MTPSTTTKKTGIGPKPENIALDFIGKDDVDPVFIEDKADVAVNDVEESKKSGLYSTYINAGLVEEDAHFLSRYSKAEETAIYRKVDYRWAHSCHFPFIMTDIPIDLFQCWLCSILFPILIVPILVWGMS